MESNTEMFFQQLISIDAKELTNLASMIMYLNQVRYILCDPTDSDSDIRKNLSWINYLRVRNENYFREWFFTTKERLDYKDGKGAITIIKEETEDCKLRALIFLEYLCFEGYWNFNKNSIIPQTSFSFEPSLYCEAIVIVREFIEIDQCIDRSELVLNADLDVNAKGTIKKGLKDKIKHIISQLKQHNFIELEIRQVLDYKLF